MINFVYLDWTGDYLAHNVFCFFKYIWRLITFRPHKLVLTPIWLSKRSVNVKKQEIANEIIIRHTVLFQRSSDINNIRVTFLKRRSMKVWMTDNVLVKHRTLFQRPTNVHNIQLPWKKNRKYVVSTSIWRP